MCLALRNQAQKATIRMQIVLGSWVLEFNFGMGREITDKKLRSWCKVDGKYGVLPLISQSS
eukprot:2226342-Rhodomonas_salina.1